LPPRSDIDIVEIAVGQQGRGRRYGIVHASWSEHEDIGADEIAVLAILSTYADRIGWCGVGQTTLGERLKRSRSWTNKVLQRLDTAGVIRIEQLRDRGRIIGCRYLIHDHASICNDHAARANGVFDPVASRVAERHTESPQIHRESPSLRVNAAGQGEDEGFGEGRSVGETTAVFAPAFDPLPADWLPSADDLAYAAQHRSDLESRLPVITQKFIQATRSRGQRFADPSAAWRCWVLRERTSHAPDQQHHDHQPGPRPHARPDRASHTGAHTSIAARNRDTARDCLERVLARRGGSQSA
jgi:hypothetical protein